MSSEDKIGEKLVESVRKSKTGTVATKTSARPSPDAEEMAKAAKPAAAKSSTNKTEKIAEKTNAYFSGGPRVWPD